MGHVTYFYLLFVKTYTKMMQKKKVSTNLVLSQVVFRLKRGHKLEIFPRTR